MPTVSVNRDLLFVALNQTFSDEEFDELCFQYGLEVDDIVDEPDKGVSYKIEVGANRYDLLCLEGIAQALNVFLGKETLPNFRLVAPKEPKQYKLIVKPATAQVRPFVVGAVLRDINFTQSVYDSFIDLQDKLHQNLARKRTLVAIGTHDLDTITGPFIYDALTPRDISFVPLNQTKAYRADELMTMYADSHLKEYLPIIRDKPVYPVITDGKGVVLSLPPIINGDHSKISLHTRNVFIECTAVDSYKAQIVLDTMVCMFSRYCKLPFTVEPVEVEYPNGEKMKYPKLQSRQQEASVQRCNSVVGIEESSQGIVKLLSKMSLSATVMDNTTVVVEVPPTRYDILHECDIAEDIAVAYGYDCLFAQNEIPATVTIGQEYELNYHSDKLRVLLSQNNYVEAATFALCSKADMGERMRVNLDELSWVRVGNPKTSDCEAVRMSLLPGLLKTVAANKHISLPLRMFEVSDICLRDTDSKRTHGTGARNQRQLCAVNYNVCAGIEVVQGLLDHIMLALKVPYSGEQEGPTGYYLRGNDHPSFLSGFCGDVIMNNKAVGRLGLIHPEVVTNFNLNYPTSALEINLEEIWRLQRK